MKYIISESRLDEIIMDFLNNNYYPDYGWEPKVYKKEVKKHGWFDFDVNDTGAYTFLGPEEIWKKNERNSLLIKSWVTENLTNIFGHRWQDVFVKWFQSHSGLSVEHVIISQD